MAGRNSVPWKGVHRTSILDYFLALLRRVYSKLSKRVDDHITTECFSLMLRAHLRRTDSHVVSTLLKSVIQNHNRKYSQSNKGSKKMDASEFRKAAHAAIEESMFTVSFI